MIQEKWKVGNHATVVISDTKINENIYKPFTNRDIEYYGGYLVCETIGLAGHAELIANAPLTLRLLDKVCTALEETVEKESGKKSTDPNYLQAKELIKKLSA